MNEVSKCTMAQTPYRCQELLINIWLIKPCLLDWCRKEKNIQLKEITFPTIIHRSHVIFFPMCFFLNGSSILVRGHWRSEFGDSVFTKKFGASEKEQWGQEALCIYIEGVAMSRQYSSLTQKKCLFNSLSPASVKMVIQIPLEVLAG